MRDVLRLLETHLHSPSSQASKRCLVALCVFVCALFFFFFLEKRWFSSMQQQVHPASIGAEAIKSSSFPERKNSRFSVVVYWKDGEAAKELPPRREGALRVVCISVGLASLYSFC